MVEPIEHKEPAANLTLEETNVVNQHVKEEDKNIISKAIDNQEKMESAMLTKEAPYLKTYVGNIKLVEPPPVSRDNTLPEKPTTTQPQSKTIDTLSKLGDMLKNALGIDNGTIKETGNRLQADFMKISSDLRSRISNIFQIINQTVAELYDPRNRQLRQINKDKEETRNTEIPQVKMDAEAIEKAYLNTPKAVEMRSQKYNRFFDKDYNA